MGLHLIYKGDCLDRIKELDENSVHLLVTSPPYFNAKEYNKEDDNIGNNETYGEYQTCINILIGHIKKVMVPGGIVVWNTSPVLEDGKRIMIPQHTMIQFEKQGFITRDNIVWKKPDGAAHLRCGGWVNNKGKPLTWHPNLTWENVMVFKKPGDREPKEFDSIHKYYPEVPKDLLTDVWFINPETQTTWHDAPFPEELVKRLIVLYSFPGDTVLDPFLGSGTTMKVARDLGRNSIGIELADKYIEQSKEKLGFYQKSLFSEEKYEIK